MDEKEKKALADVCLMIQKGVEQSFLKMRSLEKDAPPPFNPETATYLKKCKFCKKIVDESDEYKLTHNEFTVVCSSCVSWYLFKCDKCYEYYHKSEMHKEDLGGDTDDVYYSCNDCWKDRPIKKKYYDSD
jgi:hypothetical protein